jgi:hypothetical protein
MRPNRRQIKEVGKEGEPETSYSDVLWLLIS